MCLNLYDSRFECAQYSGYYADAFPRSDISVVSVFQAVLTACSALPLEKHGEVEAWPFKIEFPGSCSVQSRGGHPYQKEAFYVEWGL